MDAEYLIETLKLEPHPKEGGFFRETYRSADLMDKTNSPERYSGKRDFSTAIYYLLTPDTFSALHRIQSDEIFHFYLGDPVEMLQLYPDGKGEVICLGRELNAGMTVQQLVPYGVWQGARLKEGGCFALLGCTVSPGFEYVDYEHGSREILTRKFPDFQDRIYQLTVTE